MSLPKYPPLIAALVTFAASVFAQLPGDFTGDGAVDCSDIDSLSFQIQSGAHPSVFDLDADGLVDLQDLNVLVHELVVTWFGDADCDGEFNAADINAVFASGKYNTGESASWHEGDWNADLVFDKKDLMVADSDGGYGEGPPTGVGGGGSGGLPLTVYELFGETPPIVLSIVTFSIGEIRGVLLSWETSSRIVQLQSTHSLQGDWTDVLSAATPDDDGRTYVALTDRPSSEYYRLSITAP
jgi:hypothetical protein